MATNSSDQTQESSVPPPRSAAGPLSQDSRRTTRLHALTDQPTDVHQRLGCTHTLREILQQPETWRVTARTMVERRSQVVAFLRQAHILSGGGAVILTGSGSSLYAGASVAPALQAALRVPVHVIPSGDLLVHLHRVLPPTRPCVVISFARSGDSPESVAVVDLLLAREPEVRHLLITCCSKGRLAIAYADEPRALSCVLDDRTCDRSLVMTSSFTNMVVAARFLGLLEAPTSYEALVARLSEAADALIARHADSLAAVAEREFKSAMILGSGCRFGAAREASLKLAEMSNGRVLSFAETYLGLRHGPMVLIDNNTLVVCFLSSDPLARAYEVDLIRELNHKRLGARKVLVGDDVPDDLADHGDIVVDYAGASALGDDNVPVLDVLVGQVLAFFHSLYLGLRPDSPSVSSVINRVVSPFTIHQADEAEVG